MKNVIKQSADILNIYIYDYIQADCYDYETGETIQSKTSANYFKEELEKYPDIKVINLYVNSGGGDLSEGMAIRNQLERHSAKVNGYVDGFACSVSAFILTACDVVKMYSNSMQFIHNAWTYAHGNSKYLRKEADELDKIMEGNRTAFLEKSNGKLTEEELIEMLDNETWLTANECLYYGLADEVIAKDIDLKTSKQQIQKMNQFYKSDKIVAKLDDKILRNDNQLKIFLNKL